MRKQLKTIKSLAVVNKSRKHREIRIRKHIDTVIKILDLVKENIIQAGEHYIKMQDAR